MKNLLKLEETGQFLLSVTLFGLLSYAWWIFSACVLLPDVSAIGCLINTKIGAWIYNFSHHKLVVVLVLISVFLLYNPLIIITGVVALGHSAIVRIMD